jgi:hypothetical protein
MEKPCRAIPPATERTPWKKARDLGMSRGEEGFNQSGDGREGIPVEIQGNNRTIVYIVGVASDGDESLLERAVSK